MIEPVPRMSMPRAKACRRVEILRLGIAPCSERETLGLSAFGELPAVHLIHGTDQVAALDRSVTHDDDLFEDLLVLAVTSSALGADLLFEGLESQVHKTSTALLPETESE